MENNKSAAVFVLLLAFLFLLTAPIVLVFGYYFGLLPLLPQLSYRSIAIAATAGLFIIPVLLIFLAALIVAVKKRRLATPSATVAKVAVARQAPASYPWEGMFGAAEEREHEEKRRTASSPPAANFKAAAAVVIVVVLVVLVLLAKATKPDSIADANKTTAVNVIPAETPSNVTGEKQSALSRILAQVFTASNATNKTQARQDAGEKPADAIKPRRNAASVSLSAAAKKVLGSAKSFGGKIRSRLVGSASSLKSGISKVSDAVWQKIAIVAVALLVIGTVFYSHRTGQLGEIPKRFREWLGWLAAIFAAARKNWLKVVIGMIFIAVVCFAIAAVAFRKWIIAKFPSVSASSLMDVAVNALLAARDFVSAYRLYILIGIFALLAIIGILFVYETRGKKGKNM